MKSFEINNHLVQRDDFILISKAVSAVKTLWQHISAKFSKPLQNLVFPQRVKELHVKLMQ